MSHTFHIPVLGLGYSIDTPLKVARYGISSVMSIVDDELIERMRQYHALQNGEDFTPILKTATDCRTNRIRAYLDLVAVLVERQFNQLKQLPFEAGNDLCRYFELLPEKARLKQGYELMMEFPENRQKRFFQTLLKNEMTIGSIDVNIMAKVDKMNFDDQGVSTGDRQTDALTALRGFAESQLESAVVLSAGMNPRLYSYLESFDDFYPDQQGHIKKRIILKVSDFRSAYIQARFLAKKGLWVSEFRVESGLNCGGHAFATEGYLLGPILEEFKNRRTEMLDELFKSAQPAMKERGIDCKSAPAQHLSVQGGIGTAAENEFLLQHYQVDATGWGSPFLLVPEVTNVDESTLSQLATAGEEDFYVSNSSPLGILFNNFKNSTAELQRIKRVENGRPGSPCTKKYLCTNTEFTEQPICTASREYQHLKIKQLQESGLPHKDYEATLHEITDKLCLCEGLCASAYLKYNLLKPKENAAVAICPGPNLAYFNRSYSLEEMASHIYGATNLLHTIKRPHMFIKELNLYINYLQTDLQTQLKELNEKKKKQLSKFKMQLQEGIDYYKTLFTAPTDVTAQLLQNWMEELLIAEKNLSAIPV
jgi:hypothetical protein